MQPPVLPAAGPPSAVFTPPVKVRLDQSRREPHRLAPVAHTPYPLPPLRLGRQLLHDTWPSHPCPSAGLSLREPCARRAAGAAPCGPPAAPSWAAPGQAAMGVWPLPTRGPTGARTPPCDLCKLPTQGRHGGCVVTLNGQLGTLQRPGLKQIPRADEPGGRSGLAPTTRLGGMPRHMPRHMPRMDLFTSC